MHYRSTVEACAATYHSPTYLAYNARLNRTLLSTRHVRVRRVVAACRRERGLLRCPRLQGPDTWGLVDGRCARGPQAVLRADEGAFYLNAFSVVCALLRLASWLATWHARTSEFDAAWPSRDASTCDGTSDGRETALSPRLSRTDPHRSRHSRPPPFAQPMQVAGGPGCALYLSAFLREASLRM